MGESFLYMFFIGNLLFLLPIYVGLDVYVDPMVNRAWFSLDLYRMKVFGGYAQLDKDGVAVHLTKKKAVFLSFDKMTDTRKMFEITQGFQLYSFRQVIEMGGLSSPYCVIAAAALQSVSATVFSVLQTQFPFLSLKNNVLLREGNRLKVTFHASMFFNGLTLSIAFTKKLLEGIINWIRRKRSTRFLKKQPNN